jgi:phosphate transport system permease protein
VQALRRHQDRLAAGLSFVMLAAVLALLAVVLGHVAIGAAPAMASAPGPLGLLLSDPWSPLGDPPTFGLRHAWISTFWITLVALVLALPLGVGVGVFVIEVAPAALRLALPPILELLAGVPSVVYGFLGYVTLVAWSESALGSATGESLLVAGVVLAVMVLPFVGSTAIHAFRAVPPELREAAYALGLSRWHVVSRVVVRRAWPALFAAFALGFTRAVGETLAVLMLAGNSTEIPRTPLDRGQPLTALIATELGEAGVGSPKSQALMAAALLLMAVAVGANALIWALKRRLVPRAA